MNTDGSLKSVGIQCALCHSTVDNRFAPGVGHRLDGWPNRDLNVGAIVALSPDLSSVSSLLGVSDATVRTVLNSWGPGRFDAELFLDGKAFRPDGKSAATLMPAAFGLAGVNMHTYQAGGASHTGMPSSRISRCTARETSTTRDWTMPSSSRLRRRHGSVTSRTTRTSSLRSWQRSTSTSFRFPRRARTAVHSITPRRIEGETCSTGRPAARPATCLRCSPSPAGTCTRQMRSGSTRSSRTDLLTGAIGRRRSRACSPGHRRVLSRRPIPDLAGRGQSLRRVLQPAAERAAEAGPGRVLSKSV